MENVKDNTQGVGGHSSPEETPYIPSAEKHHHRPHEMFSDAKHVLTPQVRTGRTGLLGTNLSHHTFSTLTSPDPGVPAHW